MTDAERIQLLTEIVNETVDTLQDMKAMGGFPLTNADRFGSYAESTLKYIQPKLDKLGWRPDNE